MQRTNVRRNCFVSHLTRMRQEAVEPEGFFITPLLMVKNVNPRYPGLKPVHRDPVFPCVGEYHSKYGHHIASGADIAYNPIMF